MPKRFLGTCLIVLCLNVAGFSQQLDNINLYVGSGSEPVKIWSPLYGEGRNSNSGQWDMGNKGTNWNTKYFHVGRDYFAVDINIGGGSDDLGSPVYAPISGFVFSGPHSEYGNNVIIWDERSGKAVRLAHLDSFAPRMNGLRGEYYSVGSLLGYVGGTPNFSPHLHLVAYCNILEGYKNTSKESILSYFRNRNLPPIAQAQKYQLVAPHGPLVKFDDSNTVYQKIQNQLRPVSIQVLRMLGCDLSILPDNNREEYDTRLAPIELLPGYQRSWYSISQVFANPREHSVFKGNTATVYIWENGHARIMNEGEFSDYSGEHRWSEIYTISQSECDRLTGGNSGNNTPQQPSVDDLVRADLDWEKNHHWWIKNRASETVEWISPNDYWEFRRIPYTTVWGARIYMHHAWSKTNPDVRFGCYEASWGRSKWNQVWR